MVDFLIVHVELNQYHVTYLVNLSSVLLYYNRVYTTRNFEFPCQSRTPLYVNLDTVHALRASLRTIASFRHLDILQYEAMERSSS